MGGHSEAWSGGVSKLIHPLESRFPCSGEPLKVWGKPSEKKQIQFLEDQEGKRQQYLVKKE